MKIEKKHYKKRPFVTSSNGLYEKQTRNMPRLSALERERAVYLTCFGTTNNNIAIKFGCTKQTVIKLFEQVNQIKHTVNCPRSEMQRSTMPQTDQYLRCCFYVIGTE